MGELADRVETMRVRATAPDGSLTAELYDRDQLTLTFHNDYYRQCDDDDLGRRLAAVASLLWVARTREYERIYSDVTGDYSTGEGPPATERERDWRAERDAIEAHGASEDGRVRVRAVGLRNWTVTIRPGTTRTLDEQQFIAAAGQAAGALIRDQFTRLAALSNKYYGNDQP
ncbi:hypothetical protein AB0M54_37870 [Actinoplanes sp. NPDC051470]|uniref:hypothetical protein n=1 Tax=Actinoplanes sp. NPDC051470 TaxID=3157224 RepID=UPI00343D613B